MSDGSNEQLTSLLAQCARWHRQWAESYDPKLSEQDRVIHAAHLEAAAVFERHAAELEPARCLFCDGTGSRIAEDDPRKPTYNCGVCNGTGRTPSDAGEG